MNNKLPIIFSCVGLLTACVSLTRYDENTYKSLTYLKAEVGVFMSNCAREGASGEKALTTLENLRLKFSQAYEYELGKQYNDDVAIQMAILKDRFFDDIYTRYSKNKFYNNLCNAGGNGEKPDYSNGCLTAGYCQVKSKSIAIAFDEIISTESKKNK